MSPEQCRGVNVERGTDIYALGMILYEMFAGQLPFKGSFAELITHHLITVPEPPSRHRPMPRALDQLILRCLDKDPGAAAADGGRAVARAGGGAARRRAPRSRRRALAGRAAGAAAAAPATRCRRGDTLSPPPGRTASDLTIQPARQRGPLVWALAAAAAAAVASSRSSLGGRNGGGDKGSLVVVTDAQSPPAAPAGQAGAGARARGREGRRRRARAGRRQAGRGRRARGARPRSAAGRAARAARRGRRTARRTSARSRSPRARRRSWRCRSRRRRRPYPQWPRPARTAGAKTRRHEAVATPGSPRRRHRRPRQSPDTATAWSATTSSTASEGDFSAPRLASRARRCFDRGACRA